MFSLFLLYFQIGTNLGDFQYLYIDFWLATIFVFVSKGIRRILYMYHYMSLTLQWGSMPHTLPS